jgi:multiple sugar transport system permease protein
MALILLAGLKTLPTDILEAAAVDGANGPQRFWLMVLRYCCRRLFSH